MTKKEKKKAVESDGGVRPSLSVRLIRHAESRNNTVYRNARFLFRGGTPDFDGPGWAAYVGEHRRADPGLSEPVGRQQAELLAANYLLPVIENTASHPVTIIVSPMRRTLLTLRPTLQKLNKEGNKIAANVTVHGFYFESEGCHTEDTPEEGMNPNQIRDLLLHSRDDQDGEDEEGSAAAFAVRFTGFPDSNRGWYCLGKGPETRAESEDRAAKFYLWLCEMLDQQLSQKTDCIFDAGAEEEEEEVPDDSPGEEDDNNSNQGRRRRRRRRRTVVLVGHGDFMSLVLKRIVAAYGYQVEQTGVPHRAAFVHWNTGITELEYFGQGRWLVMSQNATPHLIGADPQLRTGGSLKDGWSFLMPHVPGHLEDEVSVAFSDEEWDDHVREQAVALKSLYLSSSTDQLSEVDNENQLSVEQEETAKDKQERVKHFVVKRGHQVVGVATYSEDTGRLFDVAVRPSAGPLAANSLFAAVKQHQRKLGRSGSLLVQPRTAESKQLFEAVGFEELSGDETSGHMELKHF